MKLTAYLKLVLCLLVVVAVSNLAVAQMPQPFSSDFTSTNANGMKMTGKWFFAPPTGIRMDMNQMPQGGKGPFGGNVSMIVNNSTQTSYMLMHQMQMYMEFHNNSDNMMQQQMRSFQNLGRGADPCTGRTDATCKKVGTEAVNGRMCDKWEITDKNGKTSTAWVDQKLIFPLKVQESSGTQIEFTNIKEGAQDPALFKVPAGYKPFDPAAFGGGRRPQ